MRKLIPVAAALVCTLGLTCKAKSSRPTLEPQRSAVPERELLPPLDWSRDEGVIGSWHDPMWDERKTISKEGDLLYLTDGYGKQALEPWSECQPCEGRAYALSDRSGRPDNVFVVTAAGVLRQHTNCEFGPCTSFREMRRVR